MKLRDDSNEYNSLYHLALWWARADSTNFTYEEFIRSLNVALNKITAVIQRHDSSWKSHDKNSPTDELISYANIVSGTSKTTIASNWRKIARVRILEQDGTTWRTIENKNRQNASDMDLISNYISGYYLLGGYLYLIGIPNYSVTNGVEVQFQEGPTHFDPATDDDVSVGFDEISEELAALMPALDYLEINGPDEQARKVEKKIGIEPREGREGSGLLNELALSYRERNNAPESLSLAKSTRALGLLDSNSGNNPMTF